jgi:dTMP kinase
MGYSTMTPLCRKIVAMPLITFGGSKTWGELTQVKGSAARLEKWGIAPAVLREPGGTAIGEVIRHLLQHSEDNHAMTPETEVILFEVSRSQLMREKLQPAWRRDEWVICNRFFFQPRFYQSATRQLDLGLVEKRNAFAVGDCVPDVIFVLDIDGRIALDTIENQIWNTFGQRFPDFGKHQTPKTKIQTS